MGDYIVLSLLYTPNDGSMLGHRCTRWPNIEPSLDCDPLLDTDDQQRDGRLYAPATTTHFLILTKC